MDVPEYGKHAKLLKVKAEVTLHVSEAIEVLGRAKSEGIDVSEVSAQFFADSLLGRQREEKTFAERATDTVGLESASSISSSPPELCQCEVHQNNLPQDSARSDGTGGKNKRPRANTDQSSEQDLHEIKRVKTEDTTEDEDTEPLEYSDVTLCQTSEDAEAQPSAQYEQDRRWLALLDELEEPYLEFLKKGEERDAPSLFELSRDCSDFECPKYVKTISCFYLNGYGNTNIKYCGCEGLDQVLIFNGLFPTSTCQQVPLAISTGVLSSYLEGLQSDGANSVETFIETLISAYSSRGYPTTFDCKGNPVVAELRGVFEVALPWYKELRFRGVYHFQSAGAPGPSCT